MRTERLFIQPLQAADAFQLVVLTNDPLVAAGVSLLRQPFTLADAQDLIALPRAKKGCFASVRAGDDGAFIGCVGAVATLRPMSKSASGSAFPITAIIMARKWRRPCWVACATSSRKSGSLQNVRARIRPHGGS